MNVNCWTFNLLTTAKMFTSLKRRKVFYYERGEYFCDYVFVCVCVLWNCLVCLGADESMHFPFKDTTCLISQSDQLKHCSNIFIYAIRKKKQPYQPSTSTWWFYLSHSTQIIIIIIIMWPSLKMENNALDTHTDGNCENKLHCPRNEIVFSWKWTWN